MSKQSLKPKGVKKIMSFLKKFKNIKQLDDMIKKYEQKKSKNSKSLYYLTGYDIKTKEITGEQVSISEFISKLKKINKADFIRQCEAISKNSKSGQFGGGITAKFFIMLSNITLGIAVIYIVCSGSAAQSSISAGFGALVSGNCNSFSELSFRYFGLGNSVCSAWTSAVTTLYLAATGSPAAIAKITGVTVMIMKSPEWVPRLHCAFMVKLAEVCVLGGVMEKREVDVLNDMYRRDGPEILALEDA